jgi:hypothetical protein
MRYALAYQSINFKGLVTMKTILVCNAIASFILILFSMYCFGIEAITELELLAVFLFSVFTGLYSLYEANNLPYND